jgi:hypothetical protein
MSVEARLTHGHGHRDPPPDAVPEIDVDPLVANRDRSLALEVRIRIGPVTG